MLQCGCYNFASCLHTMRLANTVRRYRIYTTFITSNTMCLNKMFHQGGRTRFAPTTVYAINCNITLGHNMSFILHQLSSRTGNGGSPCGRPMTAPTDYTYHSSHQNIFIKQTPTGFATFIKFDLTYNYTFKKPEQKCSGFFCSTKCKCVVV